MLNFLTKSPEETFSIGEKFAQLLKEGTVISELVKLATEKTDFTENDIMNRTEEITSQFVNYLKGNALIKQ